MSSPIRERSPRSAATIRGALLLALAGVTTTFMGVDVIHADPPRGATAAPRDRVVRRNRTSAPGHWLLPRVDQVLQQSQARNCRRVTLHECNMIEWLWNVDATTCSEPSACRCRPSNDDCENAILVPVGSYAINTHCATTDGFNPVTSCLCSDFLTDDIWFDFRIPETIPGGMCELTVSMCGTGSTPDESAPFDSYMAIYRDPDNPSVCPCPTTAGIAATTVLDAADDTCRGNLGSSGPGHVVVPDVLPGCITIRLGGWNGAKGAGLVNISCGPAYCGDNRRNGEEQCDGTDKGDCGFDACLADCTCAPEPVCGDGVVTGKEQCDPNANVPPPLRADGCYPQSDCDDLSCICAAFCGNNHAETGEACDGTDSAKCLGECSNCACPVYECGNGIVEPLNGEQCEFDSNCANLGGGNCRPPGDLFGGCTCACAAIQAPPNIVWDSEVTAATRATRTLTMSLAYPTATAPPLTSALRIKLVDLQHPDPKNRPANPPPNFTAFDTTVNGVCSGATTSPNYNGHHCNEHTGFLDCLGPNGSITTDDGTCGSLLGCEASGEVNGCVRWVGPVTTFREKQGVPGLGTYKAGRLQCTPYYRDWTALGQFSVFGAEIIPSSTYEAQAFGADCEGRESICGNLSPAVSQLTRRSGDVTFPWNPPDISDQPTGGDVVEVLNKFKGAPGSPPNIAALIFGNVPDPNADVGGQEIGETVSAFKGLAYPFSGPCVCPSTATCNQIACSSTNSAPCGAGLCVITCVGGSNAGLPCRDFPPNTPADHCPGGTCPTTGFCRDRCGRCK